MKHVIAFLSAVFVTFLSVSIADAETPAPKIKYNFVSTFSNEQANDTRSRKRLKNRTRKTASYKGKKLVDYRTTEKPGTIIVDTSKRKLFLVQKGGKAWMYGVGVGRQGFQWSGVATIRRKTKWPVWTPPASMIERQPELAKFAHGMPGGVDNPLGARALYLYKGGRDTLYRLHGTSQAASIGRAVSSGCIRILNNEVVDLYKRVPIGTKVLVL